GEAVPAPQRRRRVPRPARARRPHRADRRLCRPRRGCACAHPHRGDGDPALVLSPGNLFEQSDGVGWASPTGRDLASEGDAHPTGSPSTIGLFRNKGVDRRKWLTAKNLWIVLQLEATPYTAGS